MHSQFCSEKAEAPAIHGWLKLSPSMYVLKVVLYKTDHISWYYELCVFV